MERKQTGEMQMVVTSHPKVRTVYIPALEMDVTLQAYVKAIRTAKANPDATFDRGLTSWWPTTGAQIMRQFRDSIHDRISQGIPYVQRGQ